MQRTRYGHSGAKSRTLFDKKCDCVNHDVFTTDRKRFNLRSRNYFATRSKYRELLERSLLTTRTYYICTASLEYGRVKLDQFLAGENIDSTTSDNIKITSTAQNALSWQ